MRYEFKLLDGGRNKIKKPLLVDFLLLEQN